MAKDPQLNLSTIDGKLVDGLDFCLKVYDLFEQIKREPDGTRRLRLRESRADKRLVEELLPLARYIQTRYQAGRRINVRWFSGSQPYDAVLWSSGSCVTHGDAPRKVFIEITTSVHPNDYLLRQLLHQRGGSFGVKGIHREGRSVLSEPHVYQGGENAKDVAEQVLKSLKAKANKAYPPSTVLIVDCMPTSRPMFEDEWKDAVEQIRLAKPNIPFREVFLLEMQMSYTATLYGSRERSRGRTSQKSSR